MLPPRIPSSVPVDKRHYGDRLARQDLVERDAVKAPHAACRNDGVGDASCNELIIARKRRPARREGLEQNLILPAAWSVSAPRSRRSTASTR